MRRNRPNTRIPTPAHHRPHAHRRHVSHNFQPLPQTPKNEDLKNHHLRKLDINSPRKTATRQNTRTPLARRTQRDDFKKNLFRLTSVHRKRYNPLRFLGLRAAKGRRSAALAALSIITRLDRRHGYGADCTIDARHKTSGIFRP